VVQRPAAAGAEPRASRKPGPPAAKELIKYMFGFSRVIGPENPNIYDELPPSADIECDISGYTGRNVGPASHLVMVTALRTRLLLPGKIIENVSLIFLPS
jgi:hypothetical protein